MKSQMWKAGCLLAVLLTGCGTNTIVPNRQIGESCDNEHTCLSGLICDGGYCRMSCNEDLDCNCTDVCQDGRCVEQGKPRVGWDNKDCTKCSAGFYEKTDGNGRITDCLLCPENCANGSCDYDGSGTYCKCNKGWDGDNCDDCSTDMAGESCSTPVTCNSDHGFSSWGKSGNGHCKECKDNYSGEDCTIKPACVNGNGDYGINGSGNCRECNERYYGVRCDLKGDCDHGTMNNGLTGNGHCLKCDDDYYGTDCGSQVTCQHGEADDGVSGDGHCKGDCELGWTGIDCQLVAQCDLSHGVQDTDDPPCSSCQGNWAMPYCNDCQEGWAGADCSIKVTCTEHGVPSVGVTGTGKCESCKDDYSGINCDIEPKCQRVQLEDGSNSCKYCVGNFGIKGDGACKACLDDYSKDDCSAAPQCKYGETFYGIYGEGHCYNCENQDANEDCPNSCYDEWYGLDCNQCSKLSYKRVISNNVEYCSKCTRAGGGYIEGSDIQCGFVDSRDGEIYRLVNINGTYWFVDNLRYKNDETVVHAPNSKSSNVNKYGYLYLAKSVGDICPPGTRMPTTEDFEKLMDFTKNQSVYRMPYIAMKLMAKEGWEVWNEYYKPVDIVGFSALPAGIYKEGNYSYFGKMAMFWTSDTTEIFKISYVFTSYEGTIDTAKDPEVKLEKAGSGGYYYSVRCILDQQ